MTAFTLSTLELETQRLLTLRPRFLPIPSQDTQDGRKCLYSLHNFSNVKANQRSALLRKPDYFGVDPATFYNAKWYAYGKGVQIARMWETHC